MKKIILIIVVIAVATFIFPSCTVNDDFSDVVVENPENPTENGKNDSGHVKPGRD